MSHRTQLPLSDASRTSNTDKKKKPFEPPMNTDAHRLKAEKEKGNSKKQFFFFIMSLSEFIGVNRWLKIFVFHLFNPNLSVCSVCGSL
jgi:hypothetical protein